MEEYYPALVGAANEYINIQRGRAGLISVVQFNHEAKTLCKLEKRNITEREGYPHGGTNFTAALKEALPLVDLTTAGYICQILFFTDGDDFYKQGFPEEQLDALRSRSVRLDVVGLGALEEAKLRRLVTCGGTVFIGKTMAEVVKEFGERARALH
jgi:hypothetical protein